MKAQLRLWFSVLLALVLAAPFNRVVAEHGDEQRARFSQEELEQMLAPVALYPDNLLAQIMMAATYPLEVAEAARWSRDNDHPAGNDAVAAVQDYDWDPSVQSLVAFPHILLMMDKKLDWTESLGDAFLAQPDDVMDTVQHLRRRAQEAGYFESNEYVRVTPRESIIVVEPVAPDVVYVPYYNPRVVYGTWRYDDYPPVYWDPWPDYRPYHNDAFAWGVGVGVGVGFFFGAMDWHRHSLYVNHDHHYYREYRDRHHPNWRHGGYYGHGWRNGRQVWGHEPSHRRGAPYRDHNVGRRYHRSDSHDNNRHGFNQHRDSNWRVNDSHRGDRPSNPNGHRSDDGRPDRFRNDRNRNMPPNTIDRHRDNQDRGNNQERGNNHNSSPNEHDNGKGLQSPRGRYRYPVAPVGDNDRPSGTRPHGRMPDDNQPAARDRSQQRFRNNSAPATVAPDADRGRAEQSDQTDRPGDSQPLRRERSARQPQFRENSQLSQPRGEQRSRQETPARAAPPPRQQSHARPTAIRSERARQPDQASEGRRAAQARSEPRSRREAPARAAPQARQQNHARPTAIRSERARQQPSQARASRPAVPPRAEARRQEPQRRSEARAPARNHRDNDRR